MPAASPQTVKLKSTLRLLIPRLRNAQKKDTALSIAARREMADLLSQSREASARIRVENIIHTDITVELMEILELYAELLLARAGLLDVRDKNVKDGVAGEGGGGEGTGLEEAAASIIYSAPRLARDVRELGIVRNMLIERFGKDFAMRANENQDGIVPARVADKLKVDPPSARLVQAYLEEIARAYGVDWPPNQEREDVDELSREVDGEDEAEAEDKQERAARNDDADDDDDDDGVGGGSKELPILADGAGRAGAAPATPQRRGPNKIDIGSLARATPPSSLAPGGAKSPVSVAPPAPRSDNPSPKVKLPGGGEIGKNDNKSTKSRPAAATTGSTTAKGKSASAGGTGGTSTAGPVPGKVPTVDDLAKRFQALKR
ncbi:Vacuolar protein sorting-associated protein ist1 [Exophiala xenobiotica]|nr:Vacuolar protein sorting-associated protein ist1 [Exophiala xenobiotica]KAK5225091.1 Vacuolar protein sorting-associated protein ist1 [Exophiala xenobiotica]KAK5250587.1 Vacuolar protein sorting-associated protein ist1 [Exophiala xenobiotica]KAK5262349.1 Vacuolar protein sorting-associated protein ist1 [Exophiala xenobiotica]KAK5346016.1 Vacuolar protein sorting-associated protein ist1 [Exophiala xenobiotica]